MSYVFYAKVKKYGNGGENYVDELFTIADSYTAAARDIENRFNTDLLGLSLYCFDSDVIHIQDINEYIKEAREIVG